MGDRCARRHRDGALALTSARGGRLTFTFYATVDADSIREYMPAVSVMLPASSFARKGLRDPKLPAHLIDTAADCGGFVATLKWGDYRYTPAEYVGWLRTWCPSWAAMMDYCCEPEVTGGGLVAERQWRTTEMAHLFWREFRDEAWCWVPTIQGWEVADYRRHARELAPLIVEMAAHYGDESAFRVGIGTLCRRASVGMIRDVVSAVRDELPSGIGLHLWGVKLTLLQSPGGLPPGVVSVDSAAWNGLMFRDRNFYKASGLSQRRYAYEVALPKYLRKIEAAICNAQTRSLF